MFLGESGKGEAGKMSGVFGFWCGDFSEWMTDMDIEDCGRFLLFYTVKGGMILFVEKLSSKFC